MRYSITVDLGATQHRINLPPWINQEWEARRFRHDLIESAGVEPITCGNCWMGVVMHEDTLHAVAIPADSWEHANEILDAIAGIGQLCVVN